MSSTVSHPYEWLKSLPSSVLKLEQPSIGHSPPFPWEEFSKKLTALFEREISFNAKEIQMRSPQEFLLSRQDLIKHIAILPLEGTAFFVLPKNGIPTLINYLIKKEEDAIGQLDQDFQDSFSQFLAMEALYTLGQVKFDQGLSYQLLEERELPNEPALCIDIDMTLGRQTLHARLIISPALSQSWKERYNEQQFDLLLSASIAKKVPVTIHIEAGRVVLSPLEWRELKVGDFVVLDSCSLQPGDNKGRVMLTVNQRQFMRGKLKDGQLKLLESVALVTGATMEGEEKEPVEEEVEEVFEVEEDSDIDLSEETPSEIEEHHDEGEEKVEPEAKADIKEGLAKISAETLPMTIIIEVGRVQMPLQELLELQPGSLINLDISPQSGVDLVINGKKVGKGELLMIGETLGVRILDL